MAAADDVAAVAPDSVDDLDFSIDDFDVRDLDLDFDFGDQLAADEFCDAYSAFVANADAKGVGGAASGGWLAGLCVGGDEGSGREGRPESGVTDDGALAGDEAMSAYVAELERFMMEDDGDAEEEALCPAACNFFGDPLVASDTNGIVVTTAAAAGALRNGEEGNGDGDVLAAREEDEPTSRKRARHKIKGTTMAPWRGELEVTRRHLARIQAPAAWPSAAAALLCCM
ncbi:hypothetical protein GQ55_7G321900 [Panicum hallii var. hallii]|uniref:Uncharacterized protein n=1 Tax=Panicum hallii var. hallii TaxID=1504633 RepID=A0A2T7D1A2_9POAL|nr:hypothetical protein GQ55_7G321900 [Panicum hallii var. hallii]